MPDDRALRDLASLTVSSAGSLATTGDPFEPYRLLDSQGEAVAGVTAYLRDIHAGGRPATTVLLRDRPLALVSFLVVRGRPLGASDAHRGP